MTSRPAFYSINDNQNHFVSEGKTTSRVQQQPGGTSSISLGWDESSQTTGKALCLINIALACVVQVW